MTPVQCHVVELALACGEFPDRHAVCELLERLPILGTLKCMEIALAPQGGGRVSFVVHDAAAPELLRGMLVKLVGAAGVLRCIARPA